MSVSHDLPSTFIYLHLSAPRHLSIPLHIIYSFHISKSFYPSIIFFPSIHRALSFFLSALSTYLFILVHLSSYLSFLSLCQSLHLSIPLNVIGPARPEKNQVLLPPISAIAWQNKFYYTPPWTAKTSPLPRW